MHQNGVTSGGQKHSGFLTIHLSNTNKSKQDRWQMVKRCLQQRDLVKKQFTQNTTKEILETVEKAEITVGLGYELCKEFGLNGFENGVFPRSSNLLPYSGGDVFFHTKSQDMTVNVELLKMICTALYDIIAKQEEIHSFTYVPAPNGDGRDLSGFIDGTANPSSQKLRSATALTPGAGSYVLTQRWLHNKLQSYEKLSEKEQEELIGRKKKTSQRLKTLPPCSHVKKTTVLDKNGKKMLMVRQSQPYVSIDGKRGLFFIAYAKDPIVFTKQFEKMTGVSDPGLDGVFKFSKAVTGAYFYVPSIKELNDWQQTQSKL